MSDLNYILVVDDNISIFHSLQLNFRDFGSECLWARNETETMACFEGEKIKAVLLDLSLGKEDGLVILEKIRRFRPAVPVIMITGYGTLETAVKAIKLGAYEFLTKPLDFKKLLDTVENAVSFSKGAPAPDSASAIPNEDASEILTQSPALISALYKAELMAQTDMPVLISGESGCGKELVANFIHAKSRRNHKPLVRINCSAFPDSLIDNELFGHEKGAYTGAEKAYPGIFEQADTGTLHLDEIGDMVLSSQAKILRVLEDGMVRRLGGRDTRCVDVRIIATTNQNLPELIKERRFREDLFYRLKAAFIYLPPLRERKGDIGYIAQHLIAGTGKRFSPEAIEALERHSWPGNVRELKNTVQICGALCSSEVIHAADIPPFASGEAGGSAPESDFRSLEALEKDAIQRALQESRFNKRKASQRLGISYKTLYNKIKSYGIE